MSPSAEKSENSARTVAVAAEMRASAAPRSANHRGRRTLGVAILLLIFWSPALVAPYWQDDYGFLLAAREAVSQERSWFADFYTNAAGCFWRPVGVGLYWRFVAQCLDGNVVAAHALNILLLLASSAAIGRLAAAIVQRRWPGIDARQAGNWAMLFYGIHGARFLTAAWASAAQESLLILFSALSLHAWLVAITTTGRRRWLAAAEVLPCGIMALWSKETAVILPALAAILTVLSACGSFCAGTTERRPGEGKESSLSRAPASLCERLFLRKYSFPIWLGSLWLVMTALWWFVHQKLTLPPPREYQMQWGWNLLRNGACLSLFSLNLPREAIRFTWENGSLLAAGWGAACVTLEIAGCAMLWPLGKSGTGASPSSSENRCGRRDVALAAAFIVVGFAPHLPLAWNCYEYYASTALVICAVFLGLAACNTRRARAAATLLAISSMIAVTGNYLLPYPSLIARARWGERQLRIVRAMRDAEPARFRGPISLDVENAHKFQSFGIAGLACALEKPARDFTVLPYPTTPTPPAVSRRPGGTATPADRRTAGVAVRPRTLVVPAEGDIRWASQKSDHENPASSSYSPRPAKPDSRPSKKR